MHPHHPTDTPSLLSASADAAMVAREELSVSELLESYIDRVQQRDDAVRAWAHLDLEAARKAAALADAATSHGPLHGVIVGVKDMIDTADMPTEYGSPIYKGHRPKKDAACVQRLREAGAIVLGKTVTTEFAAYHAGKTRNPLNPDHTPGGSSSGSAAAVADFQVGIALGTQTSGSTIRPASFNGVIGFKPTYGVIDTTGFQPLAPSLDTLGLFARDIADLFLVGPSLGLNVTPGALTKPLRIGVCRTKHWNDADLQIRSALEQTAAALTAFGANVRDVVLPRQFDELQTAHQIIMCSEATQVYVRERTEHYEELSLEFRQMIADGLSYSQEQIDQAFKQAKACREYFAMVMRDYDVLLTLPAPGEAPRGLKFTGLPVFNRVWTLLHVPCLTYPVAVSSNRLPLGVQLIGGHGDDQHFLRCAQWIGERTGFNEFDFQQPDAL